MKNQRGFGALETLLIFVILGIIGTTGWYVYHSNQTINATNANSLKNSESAPVTKKTTVNTNKDVTAKTNQADNKLVILSSTKLPVGWSTDVDDSGQVTIRNKTNNCFVSVTSTMDTAESNSPSVDHNKQTIDAIKSKGYTVELLLNGKLEVTTSDGTKSLKSQEINVSGNGDSYSQSYAYISTISRFTQIQSSCTNRNDLPNAQLALNTIAINL